MFMKEHWKRLWAWGKSDLGASLCWRERSSREFSPRGRGLSFFCKDTSLLPPPWCFFLLALLAMEVLISLLVDPGEFCSPWLCFQWSWSPPSPLGLWSFLWFYFSIFSLFVLWQKSSSRGVFWEDFPLVSPAYLVRSIACCRFPYKTCPFTGFPVFFRSSRRQPRLCRTSLLGAWHARNREVPFLGRPSGPRSAFQVVFGAVRCSLVADFAGMFPGMALGLHAPSFRRRNSSPTVALLFGCFLLCLYILVSISTVCLCNTQMLLDYFLAWVARLAIFSVL